MLQKTIADADGLTGCVTKSGEKDGNNSRVNDYICKNAVLLLNNKKSFISEGFVELMTGFEPVTSSLPRMRSTD